MASLADVTGASHVEFLTSWLQPGPDLYWPFLENRKKKRTPRRTLPLRNLLHRDTPALGFISTTMRSRVYRTSDGQVGSDLKVMTAACHSEPAVQPSEPLPSKGGQPDRPSGGCSPEAAPIPPCLHSLGSHGPLPQGQGPGRCVHRVNREKWTQEKARGVRMEASPLRPAGEGVFGGEWREQMLSSCRQRAGQRPEKRAQASGRGEQ